MSTEEDGDDLDWFESEGTWRGHWREDQAPISWPVEAVRLLESREFWQILDRGLARLSPQMAIAFTLREIDGLSSEEICEVLDVTPNNLWVILHRGRAKLRQYLEAECFRGRPEPTSRTQIFKQTPLELTTVRSKLTYRAAAV